MVRRGILIFLTLVLGPGLAMAALPMAVDGTPLPSLAPVLKEVTPSVVNVYTQTRVRVRSPLLEDPFFRRFFNIPSTGLLLIITLLAFAHSFYLAWGLYVLRVFCRPCLAAHLVNTAIFVIFLIRAYPLLFAR